ncbi:hypothetical protein GCM10017688_14210 [Streptomyces ramulosus]
MVTGGASGIGRATAGAFVAAGAHVLLVDRDGEGVRAAAKELEGAAVATVTGGMSCGAVTGDISRGAVTGDVPRGAVTGDVPRGAVTGDISRGAVTGDMPRGAVTGDMPRATATGDISRSTVTGDMSRAPTTPSDMPRVSTVTGDISQESDCRAAAQAAEAMGLPVRALVNCAATFLARAEHASPEEWDRSLGVNVKGSALMTAALAPALRRARGAAVVNVASISGHIAQPGQWTYSAGKGALLALTRCQALDLADDGIRVNSVSPGLVWTPEVERMTGGDRARWGPVMGGHHILRRVGEPAEIAAAVLFLCGPGATFITGADLPVDGGYLAMGHSRSEPGTLPGRQPAPQPVTPA